MLGTGPGAVLDPASMQVVHGLAGLRVADASAMPYCPNRAARVLPLAP